MNEQGLVDLKEEIKEAESTVSKLQGQQTLLKEQLKEFGCKNLAEARKKQETMQGELSTLEVKIEKECAEIEKGYFN